MKLLHIVFIIVVASVLIPYSAGAQQTSQKPLENVLTLELQFGDKDIPDEYLLASPSSRLAINDAGDIYVFDEFKVKVYDKNGKPKTIFGGKGEGPGEFRGNTISYLYIPPAGGLFVYDSQSYSIFSPINKFINKRLFSSSTIFTSLKNNYKMPSRSSASDYTIFFLTEKEWIIKGSTCYFENYNDENEYYDYLFYANSDNVSVLVKYRNEDTFTHKKVTGTGASGGSNGSPILGRFFYTPITNSKILYTHTFHDVTLADDNAKLKFHVFTPSNKLESEFTLDYKPEAIPDSVIKKANPDYIEKLYKQLNEERKKTNPQATTPNIKLSDEQKEMYLRMEKALKQRKYKSLFTTMRNDRTYLFLIDDMIENKSKIYKGIVINSETGKEVSSFKSKEPIPEVIKNGYCYRVFTPKDGYPIVEKYRIDPRVYGK